MLAVEKPVTSPLLVGPLCHAALCCVSAVLCCASLCSLPAALAIDRGAAAGRAAL